MSTDTFLVIPPAGPITEVPASDVPDTYEFLSGKVGGWIEVVSLPGGIDVYINEEYLYSDLAFNPIATKMITMLSPFTLMSGGGIHGTAVLARVDSMGETIGLDESSVKFVSEVLS